MNLVDTVKSYAKIAKLNGKILATELFSAFDGQNITGLGHANEYKANLQASAVANTRIGQVYSALAREYFALGMIKKCAYASEKAAFHHSLSDSKSRELSSLPLCEKRWCEDESIGTN